MNNSTLKFTEILTAHLAVACVCPYRAVGREMREFRDTGPLCTAAPSRQRGWQSAPLYSTMIPHSKATLQLPIPPVAQSDSG